MSHTPKVTPEISKSQGQESGGSARALDLSTPPRRRRRFWWVAITLLVILGVLIWMILSGALGRRASGNREDPLPILQEYRLGGIRLNLLADRGWEIAANTGGLDATLTANSAGLEWQVALRIERFDGDATATAAARRFVLTKAWRAEFPEGEQAIKRFRWLDTDQSLGVWEVQVTGGSPADIENPSRRVLHVLFLASSSDATPLAEIRWEVPDDLPPAVTDRIETFVSAIRVL